MRIGAVLQAVKRTPTNKVTWSSMQFARIILGFLNRQFLLSKMDIGMFNKSMHAFGATIEQQ